MIYKTSELLDLTKTKTAPLLSSAEYPWEVLDKLKGFILELGMTLTEDEYDHPQPDVWIAKDAVVFGSASIKGPCIIGHKTEVRQCAFIRGSALIGDDCVVGNSTELKNAILFDGVQVPHFNYIGDSIFGYKAHMGAGAVTSNVKSDKTDVVVKNGDESLATGRRKLGAILGDFVEVGCNSVLNPGTVIGRNTNIYPLSSVRGVIPADSILKTGGVVVSKH